MGKLILPYKNVNNCDALTIDDLKKFNASILEIGQLSDEGKVTQSIAAMFDLEGFTDFCNQIDPHLVVPEFLRDFFAWLFQTLREEFIRSKKEQEVILWCRFPFFAKFMGDGVFFPLGHV